jgi:hypothetical protein
MAHSFGYWCCFMLLATLFEGVKSLSEEVFVNGNGLSVTSLKIAVCQLKGSSDKELNIATALRCINEAGKWDQNVQHTRTLSNEHPSLTYSALC